METSEEPELELQRPQQIKWSYELLRKDKNQQMPVYERRQAKQKCRLMNSANTILNWEDCSVVTEFSSQNSHWVAHRTYNSMGTHSHAHTHTHMIKIKS